MSDKKNGIYCSCDCVIYATSRGARPQTFGIPPEPEGTTCGILGFEETYDPVYNGDTSGPDNGTMLYLGDEVSTGGGLWDTGAVALDAFTSVSVAISELNRYLLDIGGGGPADGNHLVLGDPDDGSFADGAVALDPTMMVTEGIDRLNEVLGKLVPAQPPAFPNATNLMISNTSGNTPYLATGVTDNSATSALAEGAAVSRIVAAGVSSNSFGDVGPGDSGTVALMVNGSVLGSKVLTGTGDAGNFSGLVISDQKDFPVATPGFWKSIDIQATLAAASQGINKFQITHSGAGNTAEVYFVRDNIDTVPTISGGSVTEAAEGTVAYSSSIPHYNLNAQLTVNASYSNLAGETYYGGNDPFTISGTNGIIVSKAKTYANLGISTPIARQTTAATAISAQTIDIDGANVHNSGVIQGLAKNVKGSSATATLSSTVILVKRGAAGARTDENSVPVTGLGSSPNSNNAVRVGMGSGDKPLLSSKAAWVSSAALAAHEATVVGGLVKHDQTNYSAGFLPDGPDLSSGRSGAQYITLSFQRSALSAFKLAVTGTYAGCWIALPGVSDAQPNGSGWWDMFQSYDGSGIPGETGDTNAGCALGTVMTGASGTFQATFGTASSTNSTSNEILVRFKLTSGQSFTATPSFTN